MGWDGFKEWVLEGSFWAALAVSAFFLALVFMPILFPPKNPPYPIKDRPVSGGVLRMDVPGPIGDLYPFSGASGYSTYAMQMMYNSLCRRADRGGVEPELAEAWESGPDGLEWTFRLRRGVRFHHGREMTAEDVSMSLMTYFRELAPVYLDQILRVETPDPYTVEVVFSRPTGSFLDVAAEIPIVPSECLTPDHDWFNRPVGTGPFRVNSRKGDEEIFLAAFPDFFRGEPHLEGVRISRCDRWQDVWWRIFAEQTDIILEAEPKDRKYYEFSSYLMRTAVSDTVQYHVLLFNQSRPPLDDVRARRALSLAVKRDGLSENVRTGIRPGTRSGERNPEPEDPWLLHAEEYQVIRSLELLESAGWKDRDGDGYLDRAGIPLTLRLVAPAGLTWEQDMIQRVMRDLLRIGVRMEWRFVDQREMLEGILKTRDFDAVFSLVRLNPEQPQSLSNNFHSSGIWNFGGYSNPFVDRILEHLFREPDSRVRGELYAEFVRRITEDQAWMVLGRKQVVSTLSNYFGGFEHIRMSFPKRPRYHEVYLKEGAEPGSFQLLAHERAGHRGFWADKWTPLEILIRTP